jgi:hypothetical protein
MRFRQLWFHTFPLHHILFYFIAFPPISLALQIPYAIVIKDLELRIRSYSSLRRQDSIVVVATPRLQLSALTPHPDKLLQPTTRETAQASANVATPYLRRT